MKEEASPEQPPVPQPKPPEEKPSEARENKPAKLPAAKSLLSSALLTPAQRRQMFGDLPPRRRIVQLCQAEALAQIRQVYADTRGMYGFSDTGGRISGNVLDATGGAFNVGDVWRDVTFQCEVDVDNYAVTAFRIKMGTSSRQLKQGNGVSPVGSRSVAELKMIRPPNARKTSVDVCHLSLKRAPHRPPKPQSRPLAHPRHRAS